jgi:hypothetical protein
LLLEMSGKCVSSELQDSFGRTLCLKPRIIHHVAIFVRGKVAIGSGPR